LYAVLFNAVIHLATASDASSISVFDQARARIIAELPRSLSEIDLQAMREIFLD